MLRERESSRVGDKKVTSWTITGPFCNAVGFRTQNLATQAERKGEELGTRRPPESAASRAAEGGARALAYARQVAAETRIPRHL